jgi:hypothetical protein
MTNYYELYLVHKSNYNIRNHYIHKDYLPDIKYTIQSYKKNPKHKEYDILNDFFSQFYINPNPDPPTYDDPIYYKRYHYDNSKDYDIEHIHITDFPKELVLELLMDNFNERSICYVYILHMELVKFTYKLFRNEIIDPFYDEYKKILTNHLEEICTMPYEIYNDIMMNSNNDRYNRGKHYHYYTWWLYCYIPLVFHGDNLENKLLHLIDIAYLDDGQDMLMYGLFMINDINQLYNLTKKMILALEQQNKIRATTDRRVCFNMFSSGTGAFYQLKDIIDKLNKSGLNLLGDADLLFIKDEF